MNILFGHHRGSITETLSGNYPNKPIFRPSLSANRELRYEIASRINATWMKWRLTTGVLFDRRINEHGMETKMLCWTNGVTRFDHIRNEDIRDHYGIEPIVEKSRERRLR